MDSENDLYVMDSVMLNVDWGVTLDQALRLVKIRATQSMPEAPSLEAVWQV
jgi:hypothetical protein